MSDKKLCDKENRKIKELDSCQCEQAGWCPLMGVTMGYTLHQKCKGDKVFRETYYGMRQRMESDPKVLAARKARRERKAQEDKLDRAIEHLKSQGLSLKKIEEIMGIESASRGLGDTIEKTLSKFGITSKIVEKIMGTKGCGCNERKDWLNKIFPYSKKKKKKKGN